jgi:hypothetical protein
MLVRPGSLHRTAVLAIVALVLGSPRSARAQDTDGPLPQGCRREFVRAPRRDRRRPAEVQRDSLRRSLEDSLRTALVNASRQAGVPEPAGVLVIEIRRTGPELAALAANVPEAVARSVVEGSAGLLASWPKRDDFFSVILDPPARDETPGVIMVECRPIPLNVESVALQFQRVVETDPTAFQGSSQVVVTFLVSRTGQVVYTSITRGTASAAISDTLRRLASSLVFRPASSNGQPVDVWVALPFQFKLQR